MSPPRYHPPSVRVWMLGSKCVDDQFLLVPNAEVKSLVMCFLAKMQELYDVEILGYVVMGNHFHLILRLREDLLPDIMRDFKAGLGRALNALLGRRGTFWMSRYHDDALLDDAVVETKLHYLHANPVRAHLVEAADAYPGASSWPAYAHDLDVLTDTHFDERRWRRAGAKESQRAKYTREVRVRIGRPPGWEGLSPEQRRLATEACVANMRAEERAAADERARHGTRTPSVSALASVDPRSRPKLPTRRAARRRASGSEERVAELEAAYRQVIPAHRSASRRAREEGVLVPFPEGTYPPRIG